MFARWLLRSALAVALAAVSVTSASAANWLEQNFWLSGPRYDGVLPSCDAEAALDKISSRFTMKENDFWNSDLKIVEFDRSARPRSGPGPATPSRAGSAAGSSLISDGRGDRVHYSIVEDAGMIGMTWGVEWCVVGLDRNWAYNPACKMARP